MAKSKSSELNHLRGTIKKLQRDLKRQKKYSSSYEEAKEVETLLEEEMEERKTISKNKCPKCSGELDIIGGDRMKVLICRECDFRGSKKI